MPFTKIKCPKCSKTAESERVFILGDKSVELLKCGHILSSEQLNHSSPEQIVSLDGKSLYPFQCEGVKFIESSNARALVSDEMGLGKTVQALAAIYLHPELQPFLCVVKSSLKAQWQHEIMRWMGEDYFAQILDSPKDVPFPGMKAYIVSYDILRRFAGTDKLGKKKKRSTEEIVDDALSYDYPSKTITETNENESKLQALVTKLKIKTIILDECQQIKNHESQRAIFTREICKLVDHVIALSGTPIKNSASEYFTVLNIIKPEMFPKLSQFLYNDCDSYFNGYAYKTGGLKNPARFLEKTKSFIIRRERKDVLPDLPTIRRTFQFHELGAEVEDAYIATFKEFRDEYNSIESNSFEEQGNILAFLSKMRHLTGLSKINPTIDYIMEIMGSTDDRVTVFVHHKDVAEILANKLNSLFSELKIPNCARHEAGDSSMETEKSFEKSRVLICSTLAGGEGLNLQHLCRRFVMLERQWNPANEEQAEARFPRPEGIKTDFIDGVYMVAIGTVDEFFSEIVEKKREIVSKTLSGEAAPWDQSSLIKELAETLSISGGRRWSI
jgi:SWI/SNF-related matrix-associated actin-dependent regulator of chromatin subfamily A-like protein 1